MSNLVTPVLVVSALQSDGSSVPLYVLPDDQELLGELISRVQVEGESLEIVTVEFVEDWSDLDNLLPIADPVTESNCDSA